MNIKAFKTLIKEAVREAVREEVGLILLEQKKHSLQENYVSGNTMTFTTKDVEGMGMLRTNLKEKLDAEFGYNNTPITPNYSNLKLAEPTPEAPKANPFAAFLEESAATMTPQEYSGLRNLG